MVMEPRTESYLHALLRLITRELFKAEASAHLSPRLKLSESLQFEAVAPAVGVNERVSTVEYL